MFGPDLSLGLGSGPLCSDRHQTLYRLFTGHSYVVFEQEFTFSGEVFIWALFGPDVSLGLGSGPLYVGSPRKLTPLLADIFMVVSGQRVERARCRWALGRARYARIDTKLCEVVHGTFLRGLRSRLHVLGSVFLLGLVRARCIVGPWIVPVVLVSTPNLTWLFTVVVGWSKVVP